MNTTANPPLLGKIYVDTTKEGTTTAKITYKGQTKTFNALVTSENHSSFSNYPDTIFYTW